MISVEYKKKLGYEVEEKLINNAWVRVLKLPEYSKKEMEEAEKRLRKLSPYAEKVVEESESKYE